MLIPTLPPNEQDRLTVLNELQILDTAHEEAYDKLVEFASEICGTEIALVSLIDSDRQWFKASIGLNSQQTARDISFCGHAILQNDIFIVPDTLKDSRFADNPLVVGNPNIRFYAGAPLINNDGYALGTLCVIDSQPRQLSHDQLRTLRHVADHVTLLLNMRRTVTHLANSEKKLKDYYDNAEHERNLVAELVARMMSNEHLDFSALEYWIKPTEIMGGDLISAAYSPNGNYYVMVADSTGHGLPAAINLLPINKIFYTMVGKSLPLSLLVYEMNRTIRDQSPSDRFVAAALICFDIGRKMVEVWNGGMPDVLLLDGHGAIARRFKSNDLPLGPTEMDVAPQTSQFQYQTMAQLFACSDGLFDACNPEGRVIGNIAVESMFAATANWDRFARLQAMIVNHLGGYAAHDDISAVMIDLGLIG